MRKFNVSDRVRILDCPNCPEIVGEEATVIATRAKDPQGEGHCYLVDTPMPAYLKGPWSEGPWARADQLKLINDGDEKASWETIEEITGWSPMETVC